MKNSSGAARAVALITGASEGLGRDLSERYAAGGFDLILVARRKALLDELAGELATRHGSSCMVVDADLSQASECERVLAVAEGLRSRLFAVVNNAGFGTLGWFHEVPLARQRALIDVNVSALTHLAWGALPWLLENGRGHIMNMASVASFQPGPLMATYYASKAYVLSLSEALHNECEGKGVTITAVCPGPTRTGFAKSAGISPKAPAGGAPAMDSATVAQMAFDGAMAGKRVVVTGVRNRVAVAIGRYAPRSFSARLVRAIQMRRLKAAL